VQDRHRLAWPELRFPGGLRGHSEPVFAVCSLAQSLIATADANGAIKVRGENRAAIIKDTAERHSRRDGRTMLSLPLDVERRRKAHVLPHLPRDPQPHT
jgi:hypothetical protein